MQRVLTFTERDTERFEILYRGFILGGSIVGNEKRNIDTVRREAKILDKLCAISIDGETTLQTGDTLRTLNGTRAVTLTIDQPEHDLITKYVESYAGVAVVGHSARNVDALNFLAAAPTVDPAKDQDRERDDAVPGGVKAVRKKS